MEGPKKSQMQLWVRTPGIFSTWADRTGPWDRGRGRSERNSLTMEAQRLQGKKHRLVFCCTTQQMFPCPCANCPATNVGHRMSSWGTRQLWKFQWREEPVHLARNYPKMFPQQRGPPEARLGTTVSSPHFGGLRTASLRRAASQSTASLFLHLGESENKPRI